MIAADSSFVYYIIRMKKLFFFPFSSSIEGTNLMEMVIELSRRRMFITGGVVSCQGIKVNNIVLCCNSFVTATIRQWK